jgi:site-specific recombinase XerC
VPKVRILADQVLVDYDRWLQRQALAARTRASYRRWARELVEHLDAGDELDGFLARDGEHDRRAALSDWRRRLVDRGLAPSTVNLALAAATSLLDSRALPAPRVPRVEIDPAPPRALSPEQLRAVERETDRLRSSRDRAITELLLRTGLRIGELADLDAGDVRLTQRTGELVIRHGKGDRRRVVPLNRSARAALRPWLTDRQNHPTAPARDRGPLWISEPANSSRCGRSPSSSRRSWRAQGSRRPLTGCGTRSPLGSSAITAAISPSSPTCSATPTSRPPAATRAPSSRIAAPLLRRSTADDTARTRPRSIHAASSSTSLACGSRSGRSAPLSWGWVKV